MGGKKKTQVAIPRSICWSCVHGYADDCFLTSFEERSWIADVIIRQYRIMDTRGDWHSYVIRSVQKCDRYEYGRRCEGGQEYGEEEEEMAEAY